MPSKPKKPCNQPSCSKLTREAYCDEHKKDSNQYYDKYIREKKSKAFYQSKEWKIVRQQALTRNHHLCQYCLKQRQITPADMADHITPIKDDWSLRLVLSNLQSLCNSCHNKKTAEER
ncbi:HNH endonuclease [Chengkuizengella sediminis]|uniref:HNH endonuclease n=1 Tax=Chengkuizengella sediminis TaxID=1885917 RepID=UPI00138A4CCD|nr:HNH endonuclease [Chengkuizengella sediminis]